MKQLLNISIQQRATFAKVLLGYFLLLMLFNYHRSSFLLFQYGQPIKDTGTDWVYWLSMFSGFPSFIIQHYWACVLVDFAVVFFAIASIFSKKYQNIFAVGVFVFFFMQRITIETYACTHSKSISPIFIALFPFCFKRNDTFNLLTEFARYFLLYILVTSAFYKFHNGVLLNPTNFSNILINQHSDLAILHPEHISYKTASILIAHPKFAAAAYVMLFICQAVFVAGFFTRKYDTLLFIILIAFAVMTYLVMRIYNFDIVVLGWYLLYSGNKVNPPFTYKN